MPALCPTQTHASKVSRAELTSLSGVADPRAPCLVWHQDMRAVSTDDRKTTLSFRIAKPLEHFSKDYDHTDAAHILAIPFSKSDFASFKAKVLPLIQEVAT